MLTASPAILAQVSKQKLNWWWCHARRI